MALHRSRTHKIVAGVCGGMAESLGWSPTLVRILYIVLPPGWLVYLILWIWLPLGPPASTTG